MGLLKSTDNIQGINYIDYRDQQYYNKYEYRARISMEGLRRAYYNDPDEFEERVVNKRLYGRISKEELDAIKTNLPSIKQILAFKQANRKNKSITIRMEHNTMAVFHNDLQYLHDTFDSIAGATVDYTQVETTGYVGVKTFANEPKHKFRVYFKSKRTADDFKDSINKILTTNKQLRPSPALKHWLKHNDKTGWKVWWNNYLSSNYFIDYDDESYLSYLHLIHGDVLGKKYKLQKRPDIV